MNWAEHLAPTENNKHVNNLTEKFQGRRPLARLRHRWEDNVKMDLMETEW
jgi:hypothetical protein